MMMTNNPQLVAAMMKEDQRSRWVKSGRKSLQKRQLSKDLPQPQAKITPKKFPLQPKSQVVAKEAPSTKTTSNS